MRKFNKLQDKRGAMLITSISILFIILSLVLAILIISRIGQKNAVRELDSQMATMLAEGAIDRQVIFTESRNWNIDWNNDGSPNPPTPLDAYQPLVDIDATYQWQNNLVPPKNFPAIEWTWTEIAGYGSAAISEAEYTSGAKSAIYNFRDEKNLYPVIQNQNFQHRAVLEWDTTPQGVNTGLDVSYMGIVTGEGCVITGTQKTIRVVRKIVKVIPEAFNQHLVYATNPLDSHGATLSPASPPLPAPIYTGGRYKKLSLPGIPIPYFDSSNSFPRFASAEKPAWLGSPFSVSHTGNIYFSAPTTIEGAITGPITINGGVFVNGNLTIDATLGNITIQSNYNATATYDAGVTPLITEPRKYPAIVCTGNIILKGTSDHTITINGLIYTDPSVSGNNFTVDDTGGNIPNVAITGAIVANVVTLRATTTLSWDPTIFSSPAPFFLDPARVNDNATNPSGNDLRLVVDQTKRWEYYR